MSHSSLTKVICTVGVKSRTVPELVALLEAGMNVARFDFSWGSQAYHTKTLENLREAMKQTKIMCATMLDTRGPEIGVELAPQDVSSFDPQAPKKPVAAVKQLDAFESLIDGLGSGAAPERKSVDLGGGLGFANEAPSGPKVAPTPRRMTYDEVSPMPLWSAGVDLEASIGGSGDDMGMGFGMADDEPVVAALPPAKDAPLPLKATAAPKKKSRFSKTDVKIETSAAAEQAMAMDVDKPVTEAPQLPERMDVDESAPQADPNYGGGSCVDKMEEKEWLRDENGKHCWLYWLDCVEQSGSVYLLGKIRLEGEQDRYASACCVVRNVERSFFILPRVDPETGSRFGMKDVWEEARSELVRPRRPAVPSM